MWVSECRGASGAGERTSSRRTRLPWNESRVVPEKVAMPPAVGQTTAAASAPTCSRSPVITIWFNGGGSDEAGAIAGSDMLCARSKDVAPAVGLTDDRRRSAAALASRLAPPECRRPRSRGQSGLLPRPTRCKPARPASRASRDRSAVGKSSGQVTAKHNAPSRRIHSKVRRKHAKRLTGSPESLFDLDD